MKLATRPLTNPGTPIAVLLAGHPLQGLLIAVAIAVAALVSGRTWREVGVVLLAVFIGRLTYGWLNDVVDRERDINVDRTDKPVAMEWVHPSTLTFSTAVAVCALVPLSIVSGTVAGIAHLLSVLAMWIYNTRFKLTPLSFLPWALSFAMFPAYLSYGGWGGGTHGSAPQPVMIALAALMGVWVHFLGALPDLQMDAKNDVRSLPMVIALKIGAARLLYGTIAVTALTAIGLVVAGLTVGLHR